MVSPFTYCCSVTADSFGGSITCYSENSMFAVGYPHYCRFCDNW